MELVQGHGINDMPRGWRSENEWNKKVYRKWHDMLIRCYSDKYHERHITYIGCTVCQKWLKLSNFVNDFKMIRGYNKELFLNGELELDKDILSNGKNKEYSLSNCVLINHRENVKQASKTRDNSSISVKICQYDKQGNLIRVWHSAMDIQRELGIDNSNIIQCCKWYDCGEDLEEYHKIRKGYTKKSCNGFIFRYVEED